MRQCFYTLFVVFLVTPIFSVSAQTTCGTITAPEKWDISFTATTPLQTNAIIDCAAPFGQLVGPNTPQTLSIEGDTIADNATVIIAGTTTANYSISAAPNTSRVYYSNILFRQVGASYEYVSMTPPPATAQIYRDLATQFFTDPADIETNVTRMLSRNPYEGLKYGSVEFVKIDTFYAYVKKEYSTKKTPLSLGTYVLVFKSHQIFQTNAWQELLSRLIPTAYADTLNTYTLTFTLAPAAPVQTGASSVLFLPGIMGSRLYENGSDCGGNGEQERWFSTSNCSQLRLLTDYTGKSINQIYTKAGESSVIDATHLVVDFPLYRTFLTALAGWKQEGTIADYAAVPYDWRLRLDDLLKAKRDPGTGKVTYDITNTVEDGYLYQTLKELVAHSKSGKVTIVAHSNGGLLAKTLMATLQARHDPLIDKVDVVVLVAVPQVGTPDAIVGMLQGEEIGPSGLVVSQQTARQLMNTMPFAHHLLPNASYFNGSGVTVTTPAISFVTGTATAPWVATYGSTITSAHTLQSFMRKESGRTAPAWNDLLTPAVVDGYLFTYTSTIEQLMNNWTPAASTTVYEIAGTGIETPDGLVYDTGTECATRLLFFCTSYKSALSYTVHTTFDGDGTVVVPSALAMSISLQNVKRLWLNLFEYNDATSKSRIHRNIYEVPDIVDFVKNTLLATTTATYSYLGSTSPTITSGNRLTFTLHSPLDMSLKLANGAVVSSSTPVVNDASYRRFGEIQYISVPDTAANKTLELTGLAAGSFTLEIAQWQNGSVIKRQNYTAIPSGTSTKVSLPVTSGEALADVVLVVDYDGNGSPDVNYTTAGVMVTYVTLKTAIYALPLALSYKTMLLELTRVAEQQYQKSLTNSANKIAERATLQAAKQQIILYGKLQLISALDQQKVVGMIDVLLNK